VLSAFEGSNVLIRQLHDEVLVSRPAPSIAHNAANQPLTIAVDFDEWFLALVAKSIRHNTRSASGLVTFVGHAEVWCPGFSR
jgi:hypothetical protein